MGTKAPALDFGALARQFKAAKECPLCASEYGDGERQFIRQQGGWRIAHLSCSRCGHAYLLYVGQVGTGTCVMGSVTDLSAKDLARLVKAPEWTDDTLLDAAHVLHSQSQALVARVAARFK